MKPTKKTQKIIQRIEALKIKKLKEENNITVPVWKPPAFNSPEQLETLIKAYLNEEIDNKRIPTITGLALKLWISRQSLLNYENKDEYFDIVKQAKEVILSLTEQKLIQKETFTPWLIFYLKNTFKDEYKDKVEIDQNISWELSLTKLHDLANDYLNGNIIEGELSDDT